MEAARLYHDIDPGHPDLEHPEVVQSLPEAMYRCAALFVGWKGWKILVDRNRFGRGEASTWTLQKNKTLQSSSLKISEGEMSTRERRTYAK